jgi:RNA polymerase sigma-70 factor (ECF subfamily)
VHAFAYRRCGCRDAAEDVTAATFEQALRAFDSFQWRAGGFGPWLFRIAANEVVDHHRADQRAGGRRNARAQGAAALLAGVPATEHSWGDGPELDVPLDWLRAALAGLHPRYQRAVSLRYLSGLSHAEAAEAMGTTKPVMAVTLHRALKALRKALDENETSRKRQENR